MATRRDGVAAWWRRATKRRAVFWAVLALDLFVGLEAAAVLAYSQLTAVPPVTIGRVSQPAVDASTAVQPPAGPQPLPVAIDIPSLRVHSELETLDVDATGMLEVPEDVAVAGWWSAGPVPGADGAAVIVGHLDSHRSPGVFSRVPTMERGDRIEVRRADGSTVVFAVHALEQYSKDNLPARRIYGPTPGPELRLITCGGRFDRGSKSYQDNIVVFAHQLPAAESAP